MNQEYMSGEPKSPYPLTKAYSPQSSFKSRNALAEFSMSFRGELPPLGEISDKEEDKEDKDDINLIR